jgi:hypothetical protein
VADLGSILVQVGFVVVGWQLVLAAIRRGLS